jgi:hypothetical protein
MRLPDRPAVEVREPSRAGRHVRKSPEPDESVCVVEVSELTDDAHAERLLAFDEFPLEEVDQDLSGSGMEVYCRSSTTALCPA